MSIPAGYSAAQINNARLIVAEGRRRGLTDAQIDIALMVALRESELQNYANKNIPDSLAIPHDAIGEDHASVGVFQQQVGIWGTVTELMNVQTSIAKFYDALAKVRVNASAPWITAQAVQKSAFLDGSNFREKYADAKLFRIGLTGTGTDGAPGLDKSADTSEHAPTVPGWMESLALIGTNMRNPAFWQRAGLFALGAVLVLIAVWMILKETGVADSAVRLGTKIATRGVV